MRAENDLILMWNSIKLVRLWVVEIFVCGPKSLSSSFIIELDSVFVWAVEIDLSSMWRIELDMTSG